jgi:D-alanyl-D-alanine carboxypeptidase (penicillin-binding protein 5/6)
MKLLLLIAASLLAPSLFAQVPQLSVPPAPSIAAKSFLLYDFQSGQAIAARNPDERVEPASLTKLMTAYVTFAALKQKRIELSQVVPVSQQAWRAEGSRMFIEPRTPVSVDELIHGMIIQSGNDACIALAEAVAGSEQTFVELMNREAQRMGMKNTHFANATGLPNAQHYSSARDLALLASAVVRDFPEYYPLYSQKEFRYNKIAQANRNRLLWSDPSVDGMKTGYTENAGYCLISSAKRNQRRLISVMLGTSSETMRAQESQKLLNYGFQFYDTVRLYQKDQMVATLQVWKGAGSTLKAGFAGDLYLTIPKGLAERLQASLETQQPLIAPVAAGARVGNMKLTLDGKPFTEVPVVALEDVAAGNIFQRGWGSIRLMFK